MESLTLVVKTAAGTAVRRIPDATPLPSASTQGYAAEDATRGAAATWGLPDFVFRPEQQRVGSAVRELGDGLLLVGDHAAVLQVKSRVNPSGRADRELSWLRSNVAKGLKQGSGTIRRLKQTAAEMTNARGRTVLVDGKDFAWLTVVVIDHADPPAGFMPPAPQTGAPAIVLLRRDWEFVFDHLRSTRAVLAYLLRAAEAGDVVALGDEPQRYHEYALADLVAQPDSPDPAVAPLLAAKPATALSTARAPLEPAGHGNHTAHLLLRMIMEDMANSPYPEDRELDRMSALAALDGLPVGYRTDLGRDLVRFMESAAAHTGDATLMHSRTVIPNPGEFTPLVFIVASELSEVSRAALTLRTHLIHHEFGTATGAWKHCTVGILLTPSTMAGRLWDTSTTALWEDQGHPPEQIEEMRAAIAEAVLPPPAPESVAG